jgi:hypothetical protein
MAELGVYLPDAARKLETLVEILAMARRLMPVLAAAGGAVLGFAIRGGLSSPGPSSGPAPEKIRDVPVAGSAPLAPGPTGRLVRDISQLDAAGCEQRIKELAADHRNPNGIAAEAIFLRWISLTSAEEVMASPVLADLRWRPMLRDAFFNAWVTLDPRAAMDPASRPDFVLPRAVHAIESGREDFATFLTAAWMPNSTSNLELERALIRLARERPEIAKELPGSPPDLQQRAIAAVARGWARRDPEAALAWLQALDPAADRGSFAVRSLFESWAEADPVAAGKTLNSEPVATWLGNPLPGLTLEALKKQNSPGSLLQIALQQDPFLDAAGLHRRLSGQEFDWNPKDSAALPVDLHGWFPPDPGRSAADAANLPPGPVRDAIMDYLCGLWAEHDPDAALDFGNRHGLETPAVAALRAKPTQAMREGAFADPAGTFAALFDQELKLPAEMSRGQAFALIQEWGAEDPVAAAAWLASMPGSLDEMTSRPSHLLNNILGSGWAQRDPAGAADWVLSLPAGPERQIAWEAMKEQVSGYSPELAFSITAKAVEDEFHRGGSLRSTLAQVRDRVGREAALQLVESTDLPAAEREVLREFLNPGSR